MRTPELLAPAGNFEKLKWAILYGADAVYFGGREYSLRANADNFSIDEIKEATAYAHKYKKKVYVTVNIVCHEEDINGIEDYLKALKSAKIDAVIVSDPFIIELCKKIMPEVEIHLSTQMSTLNYEAIKYYEKLGIKRVVLGREVSKEDIIMIKENTNMDIEIFIEGAMCTGISGRCSLSNYFTMRDSNRGGCAHICRFNFKLCNEDKKIIDDIDFRMCSKDLSLLKHLDELIEMGITSFKIEGRMKSIYYIATVLNVYRNAIDRYLKDKKNYQYDPLDEKVLMKSTNREAVVQFYDKLPGVNEQYYTGQGEVTNQDFLGVITSYDNGYATIEERNYFEVGDEVEIFGPNTKTFAFKIEKIIDEEDNEIDVARHPGEILKINMPTKVYQNDIMRKKVS